MKTVKLNLTDEQWNRLEERASDLGIKPADILSEFALCLVGDGFGSDERDLASQWLSRERGNLYW